MTVARSRPPLARAAAVSAAAAGLAVAVAAAGAVLGGAPAALLATALAGLVGGLALVGGGAAGSIRAAVAALTERRAFARLHDRDGAPVALTDDRGVLRAANAAARAAPGLLARGPTALLPGGPRGRERALYRALRAVRRDGRACAPLADGGAAAISRIGPDRLLWRLGPEEADTPLHGALPILRLRGRRAIASSALAPALATPDGPAESVILELPPAAGEPALLMGADGPARARLVPLDRGAAMPPEDGDWLVLLEPAEDDAPSGPAAPETADALLAGLPVAVVRLDADGAVAALNAPAAALLGPDARPGVGFADVVEGLGRTMENRLEEALAGRGAGRAEMARRREGDREIFLQVALGRLDLGGRPGLAAVIADATELKTLEAQFVQSQKMQAVGQLAGGVAHDFNNLLTAITGHCDLLLMRHDTADSDHADLAQIRQNANRAAALVRQMLAFSRKQRLRPKLLDLEAVLEDLSHLLNRLLGERVSLKLEHGVDVGLVHADDRQLEQVIMNLVVNARDAMPRGGEVRVRTRDERLESELRRDRAAVPPGEWVVVEVSDQGVGIPPDRIGQIFEPFFTTKKVGEGTGLGLSTAYGIIKQSGGFIFADSTPGAGSVFSIWLPRRSRPGPEEAAAPSGTPHRSATRAPSREAPPARGSNAPADPSGPATATHAPTPRTGADGAPGNEGPHVRSPRTEVDAPSRRTGSDAMPRPPQTDADDAHSRDHVAGGASEAAERATRTPTSDRTVAPATDAASHATGSVPGGRPDAPVAPTAPAVAARADASAPKDAGSTAPPPGRATHAGAETHGSDSQSHLSRTPDAAPAGAPSDPADAPGRGAEGQRRSTGQHRRPAAEAGEADAPDALRHGPAARRDDPAGVSSGIAEASTRGRAVLLVEDEAPVRSFAARALRLRGHRVEEADSAEAALAFLDQPGAEVDVVVSDVVMPGMDGPTWVGVARRTRPHLRVVFISGYAEDAFDRDLDDLGEFEFLPKPFSLGELAEAVDRA